MRTVSIDIDPLDFSLPDGFIEFATGWGWRAYTEKPFKAKEPAPPKGGEG